MEFTFILLTKNRNNIIKNIKSFLDLINKNIDVNLIIVDGNKDDRILKIIKQNFSKFKNIELVKQKKGGFFRSCLIGISKLKTKFFTFVYDDDFISPNFSILIEAAYRYNCNVIGNGIVISKDKAKYQFKKLYKYVANKNMVFFKSYFYSKKFNNKYLPASPACSVFKSDIINLWISEIKNIMSNRLAYYYIINKNIGQDLLLYLISTFYDKNIIYFTDYSAQFTSHKSSMSVRYGTINLGVGYWLTKKKFFCRIQNQLNFFDKLNIKLNLFLRGSKLAFQQQFNHKRFLKHSSKKLWREVMSTIF
jgi:hypothetical protein